MQIYEGERDGKARQVKVGKRSAGTAVSSLAAGTLDLEVEGRMRMPSELRSSRMGNGAGGRERWRGGGGVVGFRHLRRPSRNRPVHGKP